MDSSPARSQSPQRSSSSSEDFLVDIANIEIIKGVLVDIANIGIIKGVLVDFANISIIKDFLVHIANIGIITIAY